MATQPLKFERFSIVFIPICMLRSNIESIPNRTGRMHRTKGPEILVCDAHMKKMKCRTHGNDVNWVGIRVNF